MRLANDRELFILFFLCSEKNKFVYEVCNIFGGSKLTIEELEYWTCFAIIQRAKFADVPHEALPMEEVIKLTEDEERKRKKKYEKGSSKLPKSH